MLIAIISDLHYHHWHGFDPKTLPVTNVSKSLEKRKPDLLIDAGDYEKKIDWQVPALYIPGNHDYYGKSWIPDDPDATHYVDFQGVKIAMATLWTDLNKNNSSTKWVYERSLNDKYAIRGWNGDICIEVNQKHQDFLRAHKDADIVVTHHCPSFKSVHERYTRSLTEDSIEYMINYGFASHLDNLIEEINPKIWIHGHTHDCYDYKIGRTRVICNPCGYPSEVMSNRNGKPYEPVYIKL